MGWSDINSMHRNAEEPKISDPRLLHFIDDTVAVNV
jgi:hypothetical protein